MGATKRNEHKLVTDDLLLNENDAADYLDLSPGTLREWRFQKKGPPYLKLPTGTVRYRQADLTAWVLDSRVDPSASS